MEDYGHRSIKGKLVMDGDDDDDIINGTIFGRSLLNIKRVFSFSVQLLSETFLVVRTIQRYNIINVHWYSCKVSVTLVRF